MADQDGRETYGGGATGWAPNQMVPVTEAQPDAAAESSPAPQQDATQEAQAPASQEGTAPSTQPVPEPKKWNEPPQERWDELRAQVARAQQAEQEARRLAEMALQRVQSPEMPAQDPWQGKINHPDPQTALFWQEQKRLHEFEAQRASQSVMQAIQAGRQELAAMKIAQFRQANPEIKPGSPEEAQIAQYVGQGFDLDAAKKLVLFDKVQQENQQLRQRQSATPKKAQANVESSAGIPAGAGLPAKRGDWRDHAAEILDKGGDAVDVANSIFGGRRRR